MDNQQSDNSGTKQERREEKLQKKRERMQKHGRGFVRSYKEAITKRIRQLRAKKQKGQVE